MKEAFKKATKEAADFAQAHPAVIRITAVVAVEIPNPTPIES